MEHDLAHCLRAWRDRLDPARDGVPVPALRRAPGMRREEVAAQAGISVNYLMRLEQGRASAPSPSVVSALARALRLDRAEEDHLHRLAGHAGDAGRVAARELTPSVRRIIGRFDDTPVIVIDPAWTIVAANAPAHVMINDELVGENAARRQFIGPQWVDRDPEDDAEFEREVVGDLHLRLGVHPDDVGLRELVAELLEASERFRELWAAPSAKASAASRKRIHHPIAGTIEIDCDVLEVVGSDLRVVVWTAAPGSADAVGLALLAAGELQPVDV